MPTHGGMARVSWPGGWLHTEGVCLPEDGLNPSTNRAQHTVTLWTQPVPLKKAKASHTCYRTLGSEPIPVYRQSARR